MTACIGTWAFSLEAIRIASDKLKTGEHSVDAVEAGISFIEDEIQYGKNQIGRGGCPNQDGVLQCDAAIMDGSTMKFGAVAALESVVCALRVARKVMEVSVHSILVGAGATKFAVEQGFKPESLEALVPTQLREMWKKRQSCIPQKQGGHDTVGVIALDHSGNISAGVSTSGMLHKYPGRVGDSPLPGGGLYADNEAGACCATGDGDQILSFCPSFHVVQLMRQGSSPQDACVQVLKQIHKRYAASHVNTEMFEVGLIAMNMQGEYGAAGTKGPYDEEYGIPYIGFPHCVWTQNSDVHIESAPVVLGL